MREALTAPFLLATALLLLAGVAKLRSPAAASRALLTLRLPSRRSYVRGFALAEITLGAGCALAPERGTALALAVLYLGFAGLTILLARRRASCGCFGEAHGESPASASQSLLSATLALVAMASVFRVPHSLGWILSRPAPTAVALSLGIAGAVYATMLAYTLLPQAWGAWSAR